MKANGRTICDMEKENTCGLTATFMKENLKPIRVMVMEFTFGQAPIDTKAILKTMPNMGLVPSTLPMETSELFFLELN